MPIQRDDTPQPTGQRNIWKVLGMMVVIMGGIVTTLAAMRGLQKNPQNKGLADKVDETLSGLQPQVVECRRVITAVRVEPEDNTGAISAAGGMRTLRDGIPGPGAGPEPRRRLDR